MSSSKPQATAHIWQSLFTNLAIAIVKIVAAWLTKSGAMLAEAIHSSSDCFNQILLFVGLRAAAKPADGGHPLGYGRALYFWSFIVALLLFSGGGVFSVAEGVEKLLAPAPLLHVEAGIFVLILSLLLEANSTRQNIIEINRRRGTVPFIRFLREAKESDLLLIFGENAAASGGLVVAIISLIMAKLTGDPRWDGVGSVAVGAILIGVAIFMAIEVKSLLIGERASPDLEAAVHSIADKAAHIEKVFNLITIQQGPNEVLLAIKIKVASSLSADEVCRAINDFERALRTARPEIRWCFVEPDLYD